MSILPTDDPNAPRGTTDSSHADTRVAKRTFADERLCPACKTATMELRHANTEVKFLQCSECRLAVALGFRP